MKHSPTLDRGPNATPRTDEEVEIAKKFPATAHGLWVSAEHARQLERELRLAQCPLHDCCGGKVGRECGWYEK